MVELQQPATGATRLHGVPRVGRAGRPTSITNHTGAAMNNATQAMTLNDYRLGVHSRPDAVSLASTPGDSSRTLPVLLAILIAVAAFGAWTFMQGGIHFLG
jgi:hypothetical protein